jgi:fructose-bisphosphate aldolase class II
MLAHIKDIVSQAEKKCYAVGAFNIHNLETVIGVVKAAKIAKSPIIIQVSEGAIKYMGLKIITNIVATEAKEMAKEVPIGLHLDHGKSFESVFECINAGFSSVHIDASHLPLPENIILTKNVVEIAHAKGVWVQGEVGAIIGGHGDIGGKIKDIPIAKADDVVKFVKETKVDTIAAAVGTAHGVYTNEDIIMPLLKEIKFRTKIPFVLHGGSGVADKKIKAAIKEGVNIINIGSDIKIAFCSTLIDTCLKNRGETDPRNLLKPSIKAVEEAAIKAMTLFNSVNQASYDFIET